MCSRYLYYGLYYFHLFWYTNIVLTHQVNIAPGADLYRNHPLLYLLCEGVGRNTNYVFKKRGSSLNQFIVDSRFFHPFEKFKFVGCGATITSKLLWHNSNVYDIQATHTIHALCRGKVAKRIFNIKQCNTQFYIIVQWKRS